MTSRHGVVEFCYIPDVVEASPDLINAERVTSWISRQTDFDGPFSYHLIAGGRSNMTFTVEQDGQTLFVLRRPPVGPLLPSAHDMAREHRLMAALRDSDVPVPEMIGLCQDERVNGRDFYVMRFVDGLVVRDIDVALTTSVSVRRTISESLIKTLVALHRVDIDQVGLGDLAKRTGYIERQVKRWTTQWENSRTRDLPIVDVVAKALLARMPEPNPTAIAHGDYRLSNCMVDSQGFVTAVLDWELCTLGEPMADLGGLLGYWHDPQEIDPSGDAESTGLPGFLTQHEMAAMYSEAMNADIGSIIYYQAFAQWRLACIAEGVYARYLGGQQGSQDEEIDLERMKSSVSERAERAAQLLNID